MVHSATLAAVASTSVQPGNASWGYEPPPARGSNYLTPLPKPRTKQLTAHKELVARAWLDARMGHIHRRFMRTSDDNAPLAAPQTEIGDGVGSSAPTANSQPLQAYASVEDFCRDLDEVVNFLWTTATPSIEISYMLGIAEELIAQYLPGLNSPPPSPVIRLLRKMDHCFASMVAGRDLSPGGQPLPGLRAGRFMTVTEMVRLKGIVSRSRVSVIRTFDSLCNGGSGGEVTPKSSIIDVAGTEDVDIASGSDSGELMDVDSDYAHTINGIDVHNDEEIDGLYHPDQAACANASQLAAASNTTELPLSSSRGSSLVQDRRSSTPPGLTPDMSQTEDEESSELEPEDDILFGADPKPLGDYDREHSSSPVPPDLDLSRGPEQFREADNDEEWLDIDTEVGMIYVKTMYQLNRRFS